VNKHAIIAAISFLASMASGSESVSIINIIADPERYNGKEVNFGGYMSLEFEGSAIYLSKDDWHNLVTKNGLWCAIDLTAYKEFDNKYVFIEGKFDMTNHGHLGLWSGSIKEIKRVWLPPPRK